MLLNWIHRGLPESCNGNIAPGTLRCPGPQSRRGNADASVRMRKRAFACEPDGEKIPGTRYGLLTHKKPFNDQDEAQESEEHDVEL
ncbi:hypothetical protein, partial [Xanthomonas populi]|uniref:hypothetical protein n=1 Tax=Xanthomonas populi TaxID=53414 RepID=UPI001ABEF39E